MRNSLFTFKKQMLTLAFVCLGFPLMAEQINVTVSTRDADNTGVGDFSNLEQALVTAGYDSPEKLATITDLKVVTEGKYTSNTREFNIALDTNDFKFLNTKLTALTKLDLSEAIVTNRYDGKGDVTNTIPNDAFQNNTTIKSINLPATLVSIGSNAFVNCALEGIINLPQKLNEIGYNQFGNSQGITGFQAADDAINITTVDGVIFSKGMTDIIFYPSGKTDESYTIPEGVITIRNSAFENNPHLKNLTLASTTTTMQAGYTRFDAIANFSEIDNIFVTDGNERFGSANGILYQRYHIQKVGDVETKVEDEKVVWSPRGKTIVRIPAPMRKIAGGGSQNSIFGGNTTNNNLKMNNNYTHVITLVDLPSTLEEIEDGAFVGASNLATIICRAINVPKNESISFNAVGGELKPQWSTKVYVPAASLESYKASTWINGTKITEGDKTTTYKGFNANNFFAFYNISTINATAQSPLANDIAAAGNEVVITANQAPEGQVFDKWITTTAEVIFADATAESTTFTMPAGDVEITATYKERTETGLTNTGDNINAVFTGQWEESVFNTFAQANAMQLTTIDLTMVEGIIQIPVIDKLNPNCLIYVKSGVKGNSGQNIITYLDGTYTGNLSLVEANNETRNNSFNNLHEFSGDISYTRSFSNTAIGNYASICLPFVPTNIEELTALEFEAFDNVTLEGNNAYLNFKKVEAENLQANVPYIIKMVAAANNITFKGSLVPETNIPASPSSEGYTFKGNLTYVEDATNCYLLRPDGSEFAKGATNSYITAFRAYLTTNYPNRKLAISHNSDNPTKTKAANNSDLLHIHVSNGIIYINSDIECTLNLYSVDGRMLKAIQVNSGQNEVAGLRKGMYLINNQKIIL